MAILQYWCPKHHTTKRLTRVDGTYEYPCGIEENGDTKYKTKPYYKNVTPICQVCRKKMVYAGSNLPKKNKFKKRK